MQKTSGQNPAEVLFGDESRLPFELKFGSKPSESDLAGNKYIENPRKKLNSIKVCKNKYSIVHIISDKMKERYGINTQAGDLVRLYLIARQNETDIEEQENKTP